MATGMNGLDVEKLDYILESKTDVQIAFINHAASVNQERSEEKRRRDRICIYCSASEVSENLDGERACGKCKKSQPSKKNKPKADVISMGNLNFVGDGEMTAIEKFKQYCRHHKKPELYEKYVLSNQI